MKSLVETYIKNNLELISKLKQQKGFKWKTIAVQIGEGIDPEYVRSKYRFFTKNKSISTVDSTTSVSFQYVTGKEDKNKGEKEFTFTADKIPSDEEIIKHFKIDVTKFRINQIYHKTSFGGKYAITVSLLAIKGAESVNYKKEFTNFLEQYKNNKLNTSNKEVIKQKSSFEKKNSVLLNLSDLHVGKLAWDKEVGDSYNVDLAKKVFIDALKYLAYQSTRCFGVEEFVLNIGGDFLHTNGSLNQTANGTNMNDVDTRYQKIYIKGLEILTEAVDFLTSFSGATVKLFIVQGNHDKATSFYLGESLKAFYRNDKNVDILNDPHIRKYHKYGVSSYMLTHGDCKDDGLPLTFATEKPDYFANSEYRYIFLGHLHKSSRKVYLTENEVNGVVSRRLNSLSVMDAWHNENNYYGAKRMANALVFDKDNGQIAEFNYIVKKGIK